VTIRRIGLAVIGAAVVVAEGAAKRAELAQKAYDREVASGSKPIEAVGTAVAAFVGLDTR